MLLRKIITRRTLSGMHLFKKKKAANLTEDCPENQLLQQSNLSLNKYNFPRVNIDANFGLGLTTPYTAHS